ncbi:MAG: endo alpha-1,4 polygalactosaminidase [Planctomycetota bacterium]
MARTVFDASALLTILNDEPGADEVAELLSEASIGTVNLSEAVAKLIDAGMPGQEARRALEILGVRVIHFDVEAAYRAGLLRAATRKEGLSLGDRACLALASQLGIPAVTTDGAWANLALALAGCEALPAGKTAGNRLSGVRTWAVQLQGLDREGAIERLERAPVDMVVIDPVRNVRGLESFPTKETVARLRERKICLAYLNVGQAESYRTYWRGFWKAPTQDGPGEPPYLLTVDPEGWSENYPVAFWDPRWQGVLWGNPLAALDEILADGFDGVFLDWVLGFENPEVIRAASEAGVDPARAMAELVRDLRLYARQRDPGFLVLAQNGAALSERVPAFPDWIDGFCQECLSFRGDAGVKWEDPAGGDIPVDKNDRLLDRLRDIRRHGVPVFTIDYALLPRNVQAAMKRSRSLGFVPCVTRVSLDRLPAAE